MKTCCEYINDFKVSGIWNQRATSNAAYYGHLDCLKYARENDCLWDEYTTLNAASYGHLDCLKYAHENGCPWNEYITSCAASNGQLDCLKYAHENGCPWNEDTTEFAASHGHLDCLKYVYENGCSWSERTSLYTACSGQLDCFKYAHEHGCLLIEEQFTLSNLEKYVYKIDLDDKWWRSFLFEKDLMSHFYLKNIVHTKKEEINNLQEKSTLLFSYISKDITKYVLWSYF